MFSNVKCWRPHDSRSMFSPLAALPKVILCRSVASTICMLAVPIFTFQVPHPSGADSYKQTPPWRLPMAAYEAPQAWNGSSRDLVSYLPAPWISFPPTSHLRPPTTGSSLHFLLHSMFNVLANLHNRALTLYLKSNYLHYYFCLWTIYYQLVVI